MIEVTFRPLLSEKHTKTLFRRLTQKGFKFQLKLEFMMSEDMWRSYQYQYQYYIRNDLNADQMKYN
jgi:hypothetical protein